MSPREREIDFYQEIGERFREHIAEHFHESSSLHFVCNDSLDKMIFEMERALSGRTIFHGSYVPFLRLDILIGVRTQESDFISLVLLEVKHADQLSLMDYSQLSGYLQVAQLIKHGVLLLVEKDSRSTLSNDFREILRQSSLATEWDMVVRSVAGEPSFSFRTGICSYCPGNGLVWEQLNSPRGIGSYESLAESMKEEIREHMRQG